MKLLCTFALATGLLLSACGPKESESSASRPASPARWVVALKPDKNPDAMLAEKEALAAFLTSRLDVPVEVIIPLSGAVIEEGLANGTIDLAYVSGSTMLRVHEQKAAELLLAGRIDGQTSYSSYWIALKDKPYTSVADLRGKPVAFASKTSTSGGLIPLWDLVRKGLIPPRGNPESFFGEGNVWFGSGYVSAVERVLGGEAEAAAVSDYVLNKDKHLTEEQRARLKKIAEQGPVPTHALAIRATLDTAAKNRFRDALLALNEPAHAGLRDRVFTSELVVVDADQHLAVLREAIANTAAP